jgi:Subtilase family/Secretion system C-terminal sorting domain
MIRFIVRSLIFVSFLLVTTMALPQKKLVNKKAQGVNNLSSLKKNIGIQNDLDVFERMEAEFRARDMARKEEALAYAFVHNIPIKKALADGGFTELQFISEEGMPIYYRTYNTAAAESTRADWLNTGGGLGLDLNGDNLVAHVWDGGHARITHQEYDGVGGTNRVSLMDTAAEGGTQLNFHAAHVTGTIASSGQFQAASKGMAWQSDVRGYMWNNDVAEATSQVNDGSGSGTFNFGYDMLLSNHSYGYGASGIPDAWFGQYGSDAVDWDNLMYNAPYYLMVVAAGNDGDDNVSNGIPLDGNSSYDKLSGHATAKNNLVIANANDAAINPDGSLNSVVINTSSSEGPTDDYRIKPDITGNGTGLYSTYHNSDSAYNSITGTSMASPNVTGSLLLLQEYFENIHNVPMRAATLKGLALHTADDPNSNGPDAVYGWGLLNTKKAAETIQSANAGGNAEVEELTLNQGEVYSVTIQASGSEPLRASISWTDPAGTQNTGTNSTTPALVNDLDLNLDNGTTFYPWRLTAITTNSQNGENNVDPFERVDIVGASGFYTLNITHDGSLSGGSQDFTLVVTGGQIVAGAPQIAFGTISGSTIENSDCSFIDISVPLNISSAATANADVDFTINGSSTATSGTDFDLLTSSVTFPSGSTASQNMTLRIYEDAFLEGDETVVVDFTVNPNGGDAVASLASDMYTFTISNDDIAPTATYTQVIFEEDLETPPFNVSTNNSGNGNPAWAISNTAGASSTYWTTTGNSTQFAYTNDDACNCDKSNDLLTTTTFSLNGGYTSASLLFDHAFSDITAEEGDVLISTDNGSNFTEILNLTNTSAVDGNGAGVTPWVNDVSIDLTPYLGNSQVVIQFRYNDATDWSYGMAVDNIRVTAPVATTIQTTVNTGTPKNLNLNGVGSGFGRDGYTGGVMTGITNNQTDDYGCTTISVSRAGTGAQDYNGSTGVNQVMDKRFTLTPTNSIATGDTTIAFYIDAAELSGWEAASGNGTGTYTMYIAREVGGLLTDIVPATVGSFGAHTTFTGSFTGVAGDYYFGRQEAFIRCTGVVKTWDGNAWTPLGNPTNIDEAIINGDYNAASDGDLDVCVLTINSGATFTVTGGNYIRTDGNINVDGTLIVEHQGSVVQVNPAAQVIKNSTTGIINVNVTTPVLQQRAFMVMGSPMDMETRNGVFTNAFLVLNHAPNNFNPNTHPNIPQGATNFSDLEGDFWATYSGDINPGEGYIVRPQTGYGDPGGISYDMTYSQGTLNNGTVNRSKIYNNTNSPAGTPNIYANPYPSAIDADQFIQENGLNALYFWEHLTAPSVIVPGEGLKFDMDDVSIRNFGGGVAANNDNPANAPTGVISTGQGFAIKATANGSVNFNNTMRLTTGNTTLRHNEAEVDRLWLHVESDAYELGNNLMIGFNPNATAGIDQGYDTDRLACSVSLYSQLESGEDRMAIQTREAFRDDIKIPVGFSTLIEENTSYTISLSNFEGANLVDRAIYLYDNVRNTLTDLTQETYTFSSQVSSQDRRFTIVFEKDEEIVLGTNDASLEDITIYPNPTNGVLTIVSTAAQLQTIKVYDVLGRQVVLEQLNNVQGHQLDITQLKTAVYFVEIQTSQGTVVKRIVKE